MIHASAIFVPMKKHELVCMDRLRHQHDWLHHVPEEITVVLRHVDGIISDVAVHNGARSPVARNRNVDKLRCYERCWHVDVDEAKTMKLKTKRVWVWCSEKPLTIDCVFGIRTRNKIEGRIGTFTVPSSVRCPECGKKFSPRVRECQDPNCWHVSIPAHKKWIKPK